MSTGLIPYWISFPDDETFPMGFGVTAYSLEEAYFMLEQFGYDYHKRAVRVDVKVNVRWDELDKLHVHPNMGPIVVRGIWYPHLNSR